jgi:hypothetical protein
LKREIAKDIELRKLKSQRPNNTSSTTTIATTNKGEAQRKADKGKEGIM